MSHALLYIVRGYPRRAFVPGDLIAVAFWNKSAAENLRRWSNRHCKSHRWVIETIALNRHAQFWENPKKMTAYTVTIGKKKGRASGVGMVFRPGDMHLGGGPDYEIYGTDDSPMMFLWTFARNKREAMQQAIQLRDDLVDDAQFRPGVCGDLAN